VQPNKDSLRWNSNDRWGFLAIRPYLTFIKNRMIMCKRDDKYSFKYDEAFATKATAADQKENLSRGRVSQQKARIAAIAGQTVLEDFETGELTKSCRYLK
jgi:hypothetical protein